MIRDCPNAPGSQKNSSHYHVRKEKYHSIRWTRPEKAQGIRFFPNSESYALIMRSLAQRSSGVFRCRRHGVWKVPEGFRRFQCTWQMKVPGGEVQLLGAWLRSVQKDPLSSLAVGDTEASLDL